MRNRYRVSVGELPTDRRRAVAWVVCGSRIEFSERLPRNRNCQQHGGLCGHPCGFRRAGVLATHRNWRAAVSYRSQVSPADRRLRGPGRRSCGRLTGHPASMPSDGVLELDRRSWRTSAPRAWSGWRQSSSEQRCVGRSPATSVAERDRSDPGWPRSSPSAYAVAVLMTPNSSPRHPFLNAGLSGRRERCSARGLVLFATLQRDGPVDRGGGAPISKLAGREGTPPRIWSRIGPLGTGAAFVEGLPRREAPPRQILEDHITWPTKRSAVRPGRPKNRARRRSR